MDLVIVESPTKASTIAGFLGRDFTVISTKGHVKNLPSNEYGILKTNGIFGGDWRIIEDKSKLLKDLKELAKTAKNIYVATDDDREGERIAWDVVEYLKITNYFRITFHSITPDDIKKAISNGIKVDPYLVEAQMARRMIDRILGYPISEMLRNYFEKNKLALKEVIKNLGIGRVSAAALGLIVQNEEKIEKFEPKKYTKVRVDYFMDNIQFSAKSDILFSEEQSEELKFFVASLKDTKKNPHIVEVYKRSTRDVAPPPPLTTSWLLRGCSSLYGFLPEDTMKIAQTLYEGVEIDGEKIGLITYMRTDSYNISSSALYKMMDIVNATFGEKYLFSTKRIYDKKVNESAQEAHEAIRPAFFDEKYKPKNIQRFLSEEQLKVYRFIYYRTVAIQMKASIYDNSRFMVNIGGNKLGQIANDLVFDGWEKIGSLWKGEFGEDGERITLPSSFYPGQEIKPLNVATYPYEERRPPRYGVGPFITTLESHQIARPSTVATVSKHLADKGYINIISSIQYPTDLGRKVYNFLKEYAPWLIDIEHAKKFEADLDLIAKGEMSANELIQEYEALKNEMAKELQYTFSTDKAPEAWAIKKAQNIANSRGETLPDDILGNNIKTMEYLKKYGEKQEKIGTCPKCKQAAVMEGEKHFYCKNNDCKFVVWKSSFASFFKNFEKYVLEEEYADYMKIILKNKKVFIHNLQNKKKADANDGKKLEPFSAFVLLKYNDQYKNWGLSLEFYNDKKAVDPKYLVKPSLAAPKEEFQPNDKKNSDNNPNPHQPNSNNIGRVHITDDAKKILGMEGQGHTPDHTELLVAEIETLKKEKRFLEDASKKDHLTRAHNRGTCDKDIVECFSLTKGDDYALAFIDVDHFKKVNDTYGHPAGDKVLIGVVDTLYDVFRDDSDVRIYRYGGEEFLLLINKSDRAHIMRLLNHARMSVEKNVFTSDGQTIKCTISIGVAFIDPTDTVESFIKRADEAMYRAKENGRNRLEY